MQQLQPQPHSVGDDDSGSPSTACAVVLQPQPQATGSVAACLYVGSAVVGLPSVSCVRELELAAAHNNTAAVQRPVDQYSLSREIASSRVIPMRA